MPWALKHLAQSRGWFALDIETSSADQSDAWLAAQGDPDGVDAIGSSLSGLSLTFGANHHLTAYIPIDHVDTECISTDALGDFLTTVFATGIRPVVHNTMFECSILFKLYGERWRSNGYRGFLPNVIDTLFEASYVDENGKLGLKHLSKRWLNYEQTDYDSTVTVDGVKYKMNQLSALHVFDYACDDTVTTAALHNFFSTFLMLEHTADILEKVEYPAAYLHIQSFVTGCNVDLAKLEELKKEDSAVRDAAQAALDKYLIEKGWDGTVPPQLTAAPTAADIKLIHKIVTGEELQTAVRTPAKLLAMIENPELVAALEAALAGELEPVNSLIKQYDVCKPTLNVGSPKQMQKLFYETMALPVQVYNPPTENMRARGLREGSPKTDNLAVTYGLLVAEPAVAEALKAVRELRMINTRFGLYYDTLPNFVHWKTGRVHSSHRQCSTNTRRASSARPNLQQLSKNEKVEGFSPRVRELYVPHKAGAAIVSLDFSSQELLLMAEWSHDPRMESCFVGETLTDMHSATGVGIYNRIHGTELSYEEYVALVKASDKEAKRARALAKSVNFGSQYRIAAKKLSTILLVTEQEAQAMLDAKAEAFPRAEEWSQEAMDDAKATGIVKSMLGAKRHLRELINSSDKYVASKAPRQALSFLIQGSAAEQTKLAEGRSLVLLDRFDCEFISSIHDECVWSVDVKDLPEFIPEAHRLMTENYAGMRLPIRSSVSIGPNFGVQWDLPDLTESSILEALSKFP